MSALLTAKRQLRRAPILYTITGVVWRRCIRTAWQVRRGLLGQVPIRCHNRGATIRLHPSGQVAEALWTHDFERSDRDFVSSTLRPDMTVLNVGANSGLYTLIASKLVQSSGSVHAFEPSSPTFALLEKNLKINGCQNVQTNHVAVWHSPGFIHLSDDPANPGADGHRHVDGFTHDGALPRKQEGRHAEPPGELIPCISLDDYMESRKLKSVDYIVMDIEGAEYDAMLGARRMLQRFHPVLFFECTRSHRAIEELLASLGYRLFVCREGKIRPADILVDSRTSNLIAATDDSAFHIH